MSKRYLDLSAIYRLFIRLRLCSLFANRRSEDIEYKEETEETSYVMSRMMGRIEMCNYGNEEMRK